MTAKKAPATKRKTTAKRKTGGSHPGRLTYTNRAIRWARGVVSGIEVRNARVVAACRRFLSDLERKDIFLSHEAGNRACGFIELLQHVKGKWAGSTIVLEDFQCFIVANLFGWLRRSDFLRRFRQAFLFMPRKNAKSTLVAAILVYLFVGDDEPGAEIYAGATTERQAMEVFGPARKMCMKNRALISRYGIEIGVKNMISHVSDSKFEPIVNRPGDGSSPHGVSTDEYHEHKTAEQYDSMQTGQGSRTQSLHLVPTTSGTDVSCPCHDLYEHACAVVDGNEEDDQLFALIFELDRDDDWTDFDNWIKVNPNYNVSVFEDFLRKQLALAMQRPSRQNIIRCKHLNQWLTVDSPWLNILDWDACEQAIPGGIDAFEGQEAWVGVDLASKVDLAAAVILFRYRGGFAVFSRFYLPGDLVERPENAKYQAWKNAGSLVVTPGARTDYEFIKEDIREWATKFDIRCLAVDPYQATQFMNEMSAEGLQVVQVRQTIPSLSEPMKELEALVRSRRFVHDGDPILRWNASNVVCHYDRKDNVFPAKLKAKNKIDGIVATITALHAALLEAYEGPSEYETMDPKDMF